MSKLRKGLFKSAQIPPTGRTQLSGSSVTGISGGRVGHDYSPIHWSKFFDKMDHVEISHDDGCRETLCVYRISNSLDPEIPIIIFLHGGGYSALTWSLTVQSLLDLIECHVIAVDLRGHGESSTNSNDLSTEKFVNDMMKLVHELAIQDCRIILVGHSMGGALAVHFSAEALMQKWANIVALVVIDVVEGSALESLSTMNTVLRNRPRSFETIIKAIEWCVRSGQIRNRDSARVSMPGQLKESSSGKPATFYVLPEGDSTNSTMADDENPQGFPLRADAIPEEVSEIDEVIFTPPAVPPAVYQFTWRIDLSLTAPYWNGWFHGLSAKFLQISCPKLLLLAGVDRLDRDLTVGQMQGKFQMQVLPNVGHAVHEDSPHEVAQSIAAFLARHKLVKGKVELVPSFPGC